MTILCLRLRLPSKLIRRKTELFEKTLQTERIWKPRRLFVFVWTENIVKTELFRQ